MAYLGSECPKNCWTTKRGASVTVSYRVYYPAPATPPLKTSKRFSPQAIEKKALVCTLADPPR
jgi:hypothetical protein